MINTPNSSDTERDRSISLTYIQDILHIGTHNIKGFNSVGKQLQFFSHYDIDYKLDIIGLTETKTKKSEEKIWSKKSKKLSKSKKQKKKKEKEDRETYSNITRDFNDIYTTWWTGKEEKYYGAGVGLAIKKSIAQRVYAINKLDGRAIMADLHFKNKINVRIIVIYMPANEEDKNERTKINKTISNWIVQGQYDKKHLIVMGDLNANIDNLHNNSLLSGSNNKDKYSILRTLINAGLLEFQSASKANPSHTWSMNRNNNIITSRIDYIWLSNDLFQLIKSIHVDFDKSFDTDHGLVHVIMLP